MAAPRRPKPEGFDETLELLVHLRAEQKALAQRVDDVFLSLVDRRQSPTSAIAEALEVTPAAVSHWRTAALKRRRPEQQAA